ncbi:putative lipid II flippase FtsW [Propionicicella superfundia]|uniref:putative lipid II flippase FtsW n=1 Tax=Propionicicella superfundia TaxID=348582 RepID=UPI000419CE6F|nr:putative lipid II flippase FtsW [Propionicicella superfundia]
MALTTTSGKPGTRLFGRTGVLAQALGQPLTSYYLVLVAASLLVAIGVMMVQSASSVYAQVQTGDPYFFFKRQLLFLGVGVVVATVLSRLSLRMLRMLGWAGVLLAYALLLCTFIPGLGREVSGNRNWVQFGTSILRFQPSEFAKLAIVVWGADVLARKAKLLDQPRHLLIPFAPISMGLIGIVLLQRDLGTAMVMGAMVMVILFVVGAPFRVLGGIVGVAAVAVVGLVATSGNRLERIFGFLNPETDALGINQQPIRGAFALASGGWWGLGLGASRQKWGMLAESHTDFIFAVIGEELGLMGTLAVIGLFIVLGYAGFRVALRSDSLFTRYAAAGVTAWFMIQSLVNIAVVLRLLPVFGVPLPFISYGGSALLANLAALGILLNCARNEPAARKLLAQRRVTRSRAKVSTVVQGRGA